MALDETDVVANELERVEPTVPTLFDLDDTFYAFIDKQNVQKVSNRQMRIPLELRPMGRFKHYNPAGGSLGAGDGPIFDKGVIDTVHLSKPVEYHRLAEWATDDGRKAVLNTVRHLLARAMDEFRRGVDSLSMTAGDGVVATVSSVSTAGGKDTVTCNTTGSNSSGWGVRLLRDQGFYSIYNSGLTTRRTFTGGSSENGYAPIDLYDLPNKQARFDGTTGATVAGDKVVVEGLTATPPVSLLGVAYHHNDASTGTWLGLDRATIPAIRANRVNAASSALALPFARLAMNKARDRVGIKLRKPLTAWSHAAQRQQYEELGQAVFIKNLPAKEEGLNMYFNQDNMQLAGAPMMESFSWDRTRIDFISKEVWGRAEMHPAGFYEVGGKKLFEKRDGDGNVTAAIQFFIVASFNLFVKNPAYCSYISNLAVPSGY